MGSTIRFQHDDARQGQETDIQDIFSLRRPKDAAAGLASGAKSVAKGVLAGTVGLFAAPAVGASQEGFVGFAKGAAAGIAGAVILPAAGVAVGIAQVGRGLANTPEAIRERAKGHQWDRKQRRWIEDPGTALIIDDGTAAHLRRPGQGNGNGKGKSNDPDYYALLGVARTSTTDEIKRAYYLAARRLHPDKNPNDPDAHERFQALAQAYQVLGNEDLRKRYDAHGTQGLDVNFMDGAEFFAVLFGSDRFEHLVGELALATAARLGPDLNAEQLQRAQEIRQLHLYANLSALLRRWVEGDEDGFITSMQAEAAGLVSASFGETMLNTIGRVYEVQARIQLGGVFKGGIVALKAQGRTINSQFKAASLAIKVYQAQVDIEKLENAAQLADKQAEFAREMKESNVGEDTIGADRDVAAASITRAAGAAGASSHSQASGGGATTATASARQDPSSTQQQQRQDPAELAAAARALHAERVRIEQASLPLMLDAMWAANALDIESTLKSVCKRVLRDKTVSAAHRRRRAEGLLELGHIFRAAKAPESTSASGSGGAGPSSSAADKIEAAMRQVAEKRMAQQD